MSFISKEKPPKDEIVLDIDLFKAAVKDFKNHNSRETAQKVLSLYKGEYLSDFEALWATAKRIRYQEAFEEAGEVLFKATQYQECLRLDRLLLCALQ